VKEEYISYQQGAANLEGYLAYPEGKNLPAVIIFHAWRGRDDFVKEQARMLAHLGYAGFAADIYGKGILGKSPEESSRLMQPFMEDRSLLRKRILAAWNTVNAWKGVDRAKIAAIGFCFGGLCALDLLRMGVEIQGVVSFHGLLMAPQGINQEKIKGKALVLHGNDDPMVPPEQVRAFAEEMTHAGVDWQMHIYGNTMHAFTNPLTNDPKAGTVYKALASKRAFLAMENFFAEIFQKEKRMTRPSTF